ncbi:MAG: hypothetical protein ACJAX6_000911 [Limisphaerales bacterium]
MVTFSQAKNHPVFLKSQLHITVAQPMNLRQIDQRHTHYPALVIGPDQTKQLKQNTPAEWVA